MSAVRLMKCLIKWTIRTLSNMPTPQVPAFLRWAGSKRKLLPLLLDLVPRDFERYVEPFAGSACLFFTLRPRRAVLGDINDELINTYSAVKRSPEEVIGGLSELVPNKESYYRVRAINPSGLTGPLRAARFIYLNRLCFNGLYRTNKQGEFNVPFGGYRCGPIPSAESLRSTALFLRRASLISGSFERTLERIKTGDFVYLDPPYCIRSRRVFNAYSHFSFDADQLKALRQHLDRLNHIGIPFLVSYGLSREGRELARGLRCREVVVQRQIAGFSAKRRKYKELLITNY